MKLSLIIPAYNEEKRLPTMLSSYYREIKKHYNDFEILIIADGKDRTAEVARSFGKKEIRVIEFKERLGKGGAVIEGFYHANGDVIGFADADGSTPAEEFIKIIKSLNGYDCAIGSRALKDSQLDVKQPLRRRFMGWSVRKLTGLLFGFDIKDRECGAKAFKHDAIKKILPQLKRKGFEFDVEILHRLKKNGYRIIEVPIRWLNDSESKVRFSSAFKMLIGVIKIKISHSKRDE